MSSNNKQRLGMGLDILFKNQSDFSNSSNPSESIIDTYKNDSAVKKIVRNISISLIDFNVNQPRKTFDKEKLQELSNSIAEHGVLQPVLLQYCSNQKYVVIAGERRCRASKIAGMDFVPAIILSNEDEKKMFEISLLENIQRSDLSPVEEARAYSVLLEKFSGTHESIAKSVGKSRVYITNSLRVLRLPDSILLSLNSGEISMGHAKILLSVNDPMFWFRKIKSEQLSVKAFDNAIKGKSVSDTDIKAQDFPEKTHFANFERDSQSPSSIYGKNDNKGSDFSLTSSGVSVQEIKENIDNNGANDVYVPQPDLKNQLSINWGDVERKAREVEFNSNITLQIDKDESGGIYIMLKCETQDDAYNILQSINKKNNNK